MVQSWFLDLILQSLVKSMCKVQIRSKSKNKEVVERACSKMYLGLTISTATARLVLCLKQTIFEQTNLRPAVSRQIKIQRTQLYFKKD